MRAVEDENNPIKDSTDLLVSRIEHASSKELDLCDGQKRLVKS